MFRSGTTDTSHLSQGTDHSLTIQHRSLTSAAKEMIEDKVFYLYRTDFCAAATEALDGAVGLVCFFTCADLFVERLGSFNAQSLPVAIVDTCCPMAKEAILV